MGATLSQMCAWWSGYYGNHQALSVTIRYVHLAALVVGGGTALTLDRQILGLNRVVPAVRDATFSMLNTAHRVVIVSLGLIVLSGVAMFAADVETYLGSVTFWTKMALVALLVVNGAALARAGRHGNAPEMRRRLAVASALSAALWLIIVYVSNWLVVAA